MFIHRPRILRSSPAIRSLVTETSLLPQQLIVPLFIVEGENLQEEISSLPGYFRRSLDRTLDEAALVYDLVSVRSCYLLNARMSGKTTGEQRPFGPMD